MELQSPPAQVLPVSRVLARVTARGVLKTFGSTSVLRGVSLDLEAGSITVLTGANGAGKSTLLSILSTEQRATRGQVQFLSQAGRTLELREARTRIGWVSHQPHAYLELSAQENLVLVARLHGVPLDDVTQVVERLAMQSFKAKPLSSLSRGQTQRVALGRALVHRPDFLLLDEPWTGLDQISSRFLEEILREQAADGAIIFIVSHQREVIAKLGASELCLIAGRVQPAAPGDLAPSASP
jgi:heme exporter protein A